jgi:hypothetical protein
MTRRIDFSDALLAKVCELAEELVSLALLFGCGDYRGLAQHFADQLRQIGELNECHPAPDERWTVVVTYDNTGITRQGCAGSA